MKTEGLGSSPSAPTNLLIMMDSDTWKLYQDLLNKKYESVDDFLTSSSVDEVSQINYYKPKPHDPHISFAGVEISDFTEDYGL